MASQQEENELDDKLNLNAVPGEETKKKRRKKRKKKKNKKPAAAADSEQADAKEPTEPEVQEDEDTEEGFVIIPNFTSPSTQHTSPAKGVVHIVEDDDNGDTREHGIRESVRDHPENLQAKDIEEDEDENDVPAAALRIAETYQSETYPIQMDGDDTGALEEDETDRATQSSSNWFASDAATLNDDEENDPTIQALGTVGEEVEEEDDEETLMEQWQNMLQEIGPSGHRRASSRLLLLASSMDNLLEKNVLKELVLGNDPRLFLAFMAMQKNMNILRDHVLDYCTTLVVDWVRVDYNSIFEGITNEEAKKLAKEALTSEQASSSIGQHSLTYGEIDFYSMSIIFELIDPQPGEVFVDLGHGTGKGVLSAALLYGHVLSECRGIEILPSLAQLSDRAFQRYDLITHARSWLYGTSGNRCDVNLRCGDLNDTNAEWDWVDGNIIFCNSTCFTDVLMKQIAERCSSLKQGSIVITLTKSLRSPHLKLEDSTTQIPMSWGPATVFIHTRI